MSLYWGEPAKNEYAFNRITFLYQNKPMILNLYKIKTRPIDIYLFIFALVFLGAVYLVFAEEKRKEKQNGME